MNIKRAIAYPKPNVAQPAISDRGRINDSKMINYKYLFDNFMAVE